MTILADTRVCVHTNCQRYRVLCMCTLYTHVGATRQRGYLSPVPSLVRSRLYSQFSISIFTLLSLARLYLTILHFYSIYPPSPSSLSPSLFASFPSWFCFHLSLSLFLRRIVRSRSLSSRLDANTMMFLSNLAGTAISTVENSGYVYLFYATKKISTFETLFFFIYSPRYV